MFSGFGKEIFGYKVFCKQFVAKAEYSCRAQLDKSSIHSLLHHLWQILLLPMKRGCILLTNKWSLRRMFVKPDAQFIGQFFIVYPRLSIVTNDSSDGQLNGITIMRPTNSTCHFTQKAQHLTL